MDLTQQSGFDNLAKEYDTVWTDTAVGKEQRAAVWRWIDPLFCAGDSVLDLGCGTGADALHLKSQGVHVYGIDSSAPMVDEAGSRGVDAHCRNIKDLSGLPLAFDGAISNFGALNCVESLSGVAAALANSVRRGGPVALCFLSRICLWESVYFLKQGRFRKAVRRWGGRATSSLGVDVFYPSKAAVLSAFRSNFRFLKLCGIGLFVPPSYVAPLGGTLVERLAAMDEQLAHLPVLRSLSDHSLYLFERL